MDVIRLPVDNWREYRDLRLRALSEDPEAFSASYAATAELPDAFWQTRLADAERGERSWLLFGRQADRLVGMIGAYLEAGVVETVTIVSVYVPREERGKGISVLLMKEILRVLSDVPALKKARLDVNVTQRAAIQVYRRLGFRETGRKPATTGAGLAVEQLVMERELPARREHGGEDHPDAKI